MAVPGSGMLTGMGAGLFWFNALRLWSSLPVDLRLSGSLTNFNSFNNELFLFAFILFLIGWVVICCFLLVKLLIC